MIVQMASSANKIYVTIEILDIQKNGIWGVLFASQKKKWRICVHRVSFGTSLFLNLLGEGEEPWCWVDHQDQEQAETEGEPGPWPR